MAYNQTLADRIAQKLVEKNVIFAEKKMMGGLAFMVNDKMCIGVVKENMMLRVMDEHYEAMLEKPHCRQMDFTGKPLKNFLFVEPEGLLKNTYFENCIDLGIEFGERGIVKSQKKAKI
jgi:TfoX/Sxy family transcriptional regulator of competence genes